MMNEQEERYTKQMYTVRALNIGRILWKTFTKLIRSIVLN